MAKIKFVLLRLAVFSILFYILILMIFSLIKLFMSRVHKRILSPKIND
jgi:hypothetical protein